jgi:hypothetical protein
MNANTPSKRGLIFEERVRRFLAMTMGIKFSKKEILIGSAGSQIKYICDIVTSDVSAVYIIGAIKDYTWRNGKDFPNGKFEEVKDDLGRLQLALTPAQRKLLILREYISLEGKSLASAFIKRLLHGQYGRLLNGIEVWSYIQGYTIENDSATQVYGPNIGVTLKIAES